MRARGGGAQRGRRSRPSGSLWRLLPTRLDRERDDPTRPGRVGGPRRSTAASPEPHAARALREARARARTEGSVRALVADSTWCSSEIRIAGAGSRCVAAGVSARENDESPPLRRQLPLPLPFLNWGAM
jgi:hypothetical protein